MKRFFWNIVIFFFCCLLLTVGLEAVIGRFLPQPVFDPPLGYSEKYGAELIPNTTITHELRGKYSFKYAVNSEGYRGKTLRPANKYEGRNIVVLGDGYSFGEGVDDGKNFAAVSAEELKASHNVVNLAVPGWGLAQQIRKYYEYGRLFNPQVVILQFSSDSPAFTMANQVAKIEDGKFYFEDREPPTLPRSFNWFLKSKLNKSQLYNFIKHRLAKFSKSEAAQKKAKAEIKKMERSSQEAEETDGEREEALYCNLLETFSASLADEGVMLLFMPVNGHLQQFPNIAAEVVMLDLTNKKFRFIDTEQWFEGASDYGSVEGSEWGEKAHALVGRKLAALISELNKN